MKPKPLKIPKGLDFDRISRAIMGKEALGFVFENSERKETVADGKHNHVTFAFHPDGHAPPLCKVVAASDPAPEGHVNEWEGSMLVQGGARIAILYRESTGS